MLYDNKVIDFFYMKDVFCIFYETIKKIKSPITRHPFMTHLQLPP